MEDELMFSMEEEGSSSRSSDKRCAPKQRVSSLTDDDDGEEDEAFMCSILEDDPVRNICQYMQNLVNNRQLSNSLPKTEFLYKVRRRRPRRMFSMVLKRTFFVNRNNIFWELCRSIIVCLVASCAMLMKSGAFFFHLPPPNIESDRAFGGRFVPRFVWKCTGMLYYFNYYSVPSLYYLSFFQPSFFLL